MVVVVFPFTFFRLSLVRVGSTVYLTRPRWPLLGGGAFGYTEATDSASRRKGKGLPWTGWTAPPRVSARAARPRGTAVQGGGRRPLGGLALSVSLGLDSWAAGKRD